MEYTREELECARTSLESTLNKCLKVLERMPSHTLTRRRVAALRIAIELINQKITEQ